MAPIRRGDGTGLNAQGFSEIRKGDGTVLWSAIPDSDVYLNDDWDDNQLTSNREGSGTTTYNGVTGYYRPDWNIRSGETQPSVSNGMVQIRGGDSIYHELNLDLGQEVTWETTVDIGITGTGSDVSHLHLWTEQIADAGGTYSSINESYVVWVRQSVGGLNLRRVNSDGSDTTVVSDGTNVWGTTTVRVTRQPDGTWELFVDGNSKGTGVDTAFTNPQYFAIRGNNSVQNDFRELKVS